MGLVDGSQAIAGCICVTHSFDDVLNAIIQLDEPHYAGAPNNASHVAHCFIVLGCYLGVFSAWVFFCLVFQQCYAI